ncbi:MAG: hypothetical protein ACHRHE_00870 [Tepidisphaerales bacterium]
MYRLPALLLLLGAALPARADLQLSVSLGWSGAYRPAAFNPVYVTLCDPSIGTPRAVTVEFTTPFESTYTTRVAQILPLSARPTTYIFYVHIDPFLDNDSVVIRDARSGRRLDGADFSHVGPMPPSPDNPSLNGMAANGAAGFLIGLCGERSNLSALAGQFDWTPERSADERARREVPLRVGQVKASRLPDSIKGYECLDLLVLSGPDLAAIPEPAQEAIARWVRAGGRLLLWPGDSPLPENSPVLRLLPGAFGSIASVPLSADDQRRLGVEARFDKIPARSFEPAVHCTKLPLLDGRAEISMAPIDLGSVGVISADFGRLAFGTTEAAARFWRPILIQVAGVVPADGVRVRSGSIFGGSRNAAAEQVIERLGDVQGIGTFDFSYVAWMMLAFAVVVGPIDWFILRQARCPPWTWATTTGWIVLVTTGVLYLGHVFRSGDVHYRTVRVIDQVGNHVVAASDIVGLYSPRTQNYGFIGPEEWWWSPVGFRNEYRYYREPRAATKMVDMVQDRRGQRITLDHNADGTPAGTLPVAVWDLALFEAEAESASQLPAVVSADLQLSGQSYIRGKIKNLSPATLVNIFIQTRHGELLVTRPQRTFQPSARSRAVSAEAQSPDLPRLEKAPDAIAPGESMEIDIPVNPRAAGWPEYPRNQGFPRGYPFNAYAQSNRPQQLTFECAAADMHTRCNERIGTLLAGDRDYAVIYAEAVLTASDVKLVYGNGAPPRQLHWMVVRALVPLEKGVVP